MDLTLQLWGLPVDDTDWNGQLRRFSLAEREKPARRVILGLNAPAEIRHRFVQTAREYGSQVWVWIPIFSELDGLADFHPLKDAHGRVFLNPEQTDGFCFRCPGDPDNLRPVSEYLERLLTEENWDGAFLDRVRYPSFQYGLPGVLGCFCDHCLQYYKEERLDPERLRQACLRVEERIAKHAVNPMGMQSFDGSRWTVADPELQQLLDARCRVITDALTGLSGTIRQYTPGVAFDLFTPGLGYFTGQDIRSLMPFADFVKPMMYLRTDAPAGLPYEIACLENTLPGTELLTLLNAHSAEELITDEIRRCTAAFGPEKLSWGIEYTAAPPVVPVTADTLRKDLRRMKEAGAENFVAAWDFFRAPDELIRVLHEEI